MSYWYSENVVGLKKLMMSLSSIVIFAAICWWLWCVLGFAFVSTNIEKGLFPHGPIKDFKDGSMSSLFTWIHKHSITLVFFYAPWSGQCIKLVPEILSAYKKINSSLVTITAINCWVGLCKERFPTYQYPRIFLYHSSYSPIEFLDDIKADAIVSFLHLSIAPWQYLGTSKQLRKFVENYDNYFVCYINAGQMSDNKVYDIFYYSSLLLINKANRPQLAIVTNKSIAAMLQLTEHGQIRSQSILHKNSYSTKLNYTSVEITNWMTTQTKKVVQILKPDPDKNLYVKKLKRGPAIILHSSLLTVESGAIQQYVNVALSYHHGCEHSPTPLKTYHTNICSTFPLRKRVCTVCQFCYSHNICVDWTLSHFRGMHDLSKLSSRCSSYLPTNSYMSDKYSVCCLDIKGETSSEKHKLVDGESSASVKKISQVYILRQIDIVLAYMQQYYANITKNVKDSSHKNRNQISLDRLRLSLILKKYLDLDNEAKLKCENASLPCFFDEHVLSNMTSLIKGLACHTNRTLNFFLLNYDRYKYLLRHLGITHQPTLLIVDLTKEEHYMLNTQISLQSITSFILRFTLGHLQQEYLFPTPAKRVVEKCSLQVVELTSLTFQQVVMTAEKHVFVMFYALWCGMCKSVNLLFLKLLHLYRKDVIFSRIDGEAHSLPWQFKPNLYPSFILFPAERKDNSVSFSSDQPITLTSLRHFLDTHIGN